MPRDTNVFDALRRVLEHAEAQGEVYDGACEDHSVIRSAITGADTLIPVTTDGGVLVGGASKDEDPKL